MSKIIMLDAESRQYVIDLMKENACKTSVEERAVTSCTIADSDDPEDVREKYTWYFFCGLEISKEEAERYMRNAAFW